jgi:two-component sensor histidine kinase/CheY-like chemotaxis protein
MLALPLSDTGRDWVLLLRDEVIRHVTWGGKPEHIVHRRTGRLSPRRSFEAWQEVVRGHCEPWTPLEIELAGLLRLRLLEVLLAHREQRELASARQAARQQSLLVRELNHRVRNMLGLIKGLVHQTAKGSTSAVDLAARIDDRVHALSRAYTQIERASWQPASLQALVLDETRAFSEPGQVSVSGDAVLLEPSAYLAFALVMHELATNARKYGALSVPEGRLSVHWQIRPGPELAVSWCESHGPTVEPPTRRGFGTRVIHQALSHQMRGHARLHFDPAGLRADMTVARGFVKGMAGQPRLAQARPPPAPHELPKRVLVVEDELLIAMLAETMLQQLGCTQVVLAGSCDEALQALARQRFDAALLDVNLGEQTSAPVAVRLAALGVPVVLATGYAPTDRLPAPLAGLPRICKPYAAAALAVALADAWLARPGSAAAVAHGASV